MPNPNYPATVEEVLDLDMKFRRAVLRAVREFAHSKPWQGSHDERQAKFRSLNVSLAEACGVSIPQLILDGGNDRDSGRSCYIPDLKIIILRGRLSVVTYLHEFAHHLFGPDERMACRWSINLFRRCFPRSFGRCRFEGHVLRRVPRA